ncbi:MAG: hypothetical protein WA726_06920 [Acidimicrobiia bacterium]
MGERSELRSTAITLGVIGVVLMGVGLVLIVSGGDGSSDATGGLAVRSGAVIGAIALVLPSIRKPKISTVVVAGAGAILALARPGLAWAALLGWVLWVGLGRQRRTDKSES